MNVFETIMKLHDKCEKISIKDSEKTRYIGAPMNAPTVLAPMQVKCIIPDGDNFILMI